LFSVYHLVSKAFKTRANQGGDKPGPYPATKELAKSDRVGAGLAPALVTNPL